MSQVFHVRRDDGLGRYETIESYSGPDAYPMARAHALLAYRAAMTSIAVEIVRDGATVWGPYVKGGRYEP